MIEPVNAWKQAGRVFIWRYPPRLNRAAGWHFTADENACDALIELIETMRQASQDCRRTIALTMPSPSIWGVPNYGRPRTEKLGPLTVSCEHSFADMTLAEDGERLLLRVGDERADDLLTGLKDVRQGKGDFAFGPSEKGVAPSIWFWWMPWSGAR